MKSGDKVYVTQLALTHGIIEVTVIERGGDFYFRRPGRSDTYTRLDPAHYHLSWRSARAHHNEIINERIESLEREISSLRRRIVNNLPADEVGA